MKKKWYESKAIWTAIATGVLGIAAAFGYTAPDWVLQILVALGIYSIRTGVNKPIE